MVTNIIKEYIKANLRVEVDASSNSSNYGYDSAHVTVKIYLEDELITEGTGYL